MRLADAWARLPGLTVQERDISREQAALHRLACWAGGFTSELALAPPQTVLLEVAGSLRLFGGAASLFAQVAAGCRAQGFSLRAALAPTPLAAQWLAFAGDGEPCLSVGELPSRLARLSLAALDLPAAATARLAGFGARRLGDVLRLPRAGLARRVGAEFVANLARALGELPDDRPRFAFPATFVEHLELPARFDHAPALEFACRRLLSALCGWLAARRSGVRLCVFELVHERGAAVQLATRLELGLSEATRDPERMERVLAECLQRLVLPAPVESLTLRAASPELLPGTPGELFARRASGGGACAQSISMPALVERLQARLGRECVHGLASVAEHRPECASRVLRPGEAGGKGQTCGVLPASGARPLWLLRQPVALPELAGRPQRGGPLRLLAGPERIESGWWDAAEPDCPGDVRRDYFVAVSQRSEWLWIFRCETGWFLHGFFS